MIFLYRNIVKLLCLSSLLLVKLDAAAGPNLAEEGSRYHGTLKAKIMFRDKTIEHDFWPEHTAMASIVQSDADEGQYSSLVRFHPIFTDEGGELTIGQTVYLTSPDLLSAPHSQPCYEVGFASGEYNAKSQDPSMKYNSIYDLVLTDSISKRGLMTLRPALHKTKKDGCVTNMFPVRFMMSNYVDPGVLKRQLLHRYFDIDGSILNTENVDAILNPHRETVSAIDESQERAKEILLKMADEVQVNATSVVLELHRQELKDTNAPNSNRKTNSYNCAEQCQFTYLQDARVMAYLKQRLGVDQPNFVGLVVSAHCSHTPCHSCMTSFTREAETGGTFNSIVNGKPVHVLCSCQWLYERPKDMLQYDQTHFLDKLEDDASLSEPYSASLDEDSVRIPYPVVFLEPNLEPNSDGSWKVGIEHYKKIQAK